MFPGGCPRHLPSRAGPTASRMGHAGPRHGFAATRRWSGTPHPLAAIEPAYFLEEASCESPIFGFRPTNFRETRKSFLVTRSKRDANLGKSQRESATRFSGNPKVFLEGSLKRNANFRVPPPLALYNIKRHEIREKGPRGGVQPLRPPVPSSSPSTLYRAPCA